MPSIEPVTQTPGSAQRARSPRALVAAALLTAGSLIAWSLHRGGGNPVPSVAGVEPIAAQAPRPPQVVPPRSPQTRAAAAVARQGARSPQHMPGEQLRSEQVSTMMGMARTQIQRSVGIVGDEPETAANHSWPYFQGWIDAVQSIDPGLADAMSDDFDAALCDGSTSGAEKLVLLRLASEEPMFATQRGLACVISSQIAEKKEDVVLWAGLEAWRSAKLSVSPELERLANSSKEKRTQRRLAAIRGEDPLAELVQQMP